MSKSQRLNASITIGSVLDQSVRRNIGFLKSGLSSVGNEIKDVERKQRDLGRQRSVLEKQGRSVEALDREYEDLNRTLERLRRQQERWNRAAGASRRVGSTFNAMASDMARKGRTIAIGLGLAGGAVFGLASSTAKLGDDVAKTADKLGIGIEELQELRYAAERSGVATSAFDSSLEKMTKNIGLALEGTGAQKDALDALGLSADDLATMLPEEALGQIADRMQGVATQAEKAAIANDIFGRSGIGLLNMLRDGSSGLRDLRDDARRTGYVLSEQAARDAEVFQDTLLDTQLTMKGLKNTVGAELMPVITQSMRRVGDALVGNREQVKVWATSFADGVERALPIIGEVAVGIGSVLKVTGKVLSTTAEMVGGWENFGVIVGAVLASRTVIRVGKFGMAVFSLGKAMMSLAASTPLVVGGIRAIGTALMMNPIGAAIAVIAGGAALIYANWDTVGPWFKGLWGDVKTYFGGAADFVGGVFTGDMERAGRGLTTMWEGYKGIMDRVVGGIGSVFEATWTNVIKPVTDALGITEPIVAAWSFVSDQIGMITSAIGTAFNLAWTSFIKPAVDGLSNAGSIGAAWDAVKAGLDPVLTWIGEKFAAALGFIQPVIDALKWTIDKGAAVGNALSGILPERKASVPVPGMGPRSGSPMRPQANALGGPFRPGWHLTGELGPELKFENRSGYVANNRAMRQLASYADRVGSAMPQAQTMGRAAGASLSRAQQSLRSHRTAPQGTTQALSAMSARIEAALGGGAPQQAAGTASGQVTQNITNHFHASGVSADELMSMAERKRRTQAQGALFDRAPVSGPFGR
ncbi:phage tail tape measure protein [Ascidiaceihabitans sp.]|uniref:phage tail tape measure protein n=1 Tax=Ascidiaceihabitans sp. TaxID=1872644 RepID=UPI0032972D36